MINYIKKYNDEIREICNKFKNYQVVLRSQKYQYLYSYILSCTDDLFKENNCESTLGKRINFILKELQEFPTCQNPNCNNKIIGRKDIKWFEYWPSYCSLKCISQDPSRSEKIAKTKLDKYGNSKYNGDKEELKKRNRELYGSDWFFSSEIGKKKVKDAWLKNGYDHPMHSDKIKKEMSDRYMDKYGVPYSILNPDVIKKSKLPYFYDGVYFKSSWELAYYIYLKDKSCVFEYQPNEYIEYKDSNNKSHYYFPDFKINGEFVEIKGDQFIQENGEYKNPYDLNHNTDDIYESKHKCMIEHGVKILSRSDILKYDLYCKNKFNGDSKWRLKFKVNLKSKNSIFDINDLKIEFDAGNIMKEFEYFKNKKISSNLNGYCSKNSIIKYFQQDIFFNKEKELWKESTIRTKLIENRCKFLKKSADQLTVMEILNGFKYSGIWWGYSHFNPLWFKWFIEKYNIKTCYDPCGGWGHRLLGGLSLERYIYNDFSLTTKENVDKMIQYFHITNTITYNKDARYFIPPEDFESMFTCPPYFNLEKYECGEFKDIQEYNQFIDYLFEIFYKNHDCKIFGFVIREDLLPEKYKNYSESFLLSKESGSYLSNSKKRKSREFLYIYRK